MAVSVVLPSQGTVVEVNVLLSSSSSSLLSSGSSSSSSSSSSLLSSGSSSCSLPSSSTSSSLDHQVLDGEGAADTTIFPSVLLHLIPSSHLIKHYVPRDHYLAFLGS